MTNDSAWDIQLDRSMSEKLFTVSGYLRLLNPNSGDKKDIGSFDSDYKQTLLVSPTTDEGNSGNGGNNSGSGSTGSGGSGSTGGGDGGAVDENGGSSGGDGGSGPSPESNNDGAMAQLTAFGAAVFAVATTMF